MMHQDFPKAAAVAARHCDALIARRASPEDLVGAFAAAGERLAANLSEDLADFFGIEPPQVRSLGADKIVETTLGRTIGPLAANSLLAIGTSHHRMLASVDARAVLAQLDRTFGGPGEVEDELPEAFPMSAELLAAKIEQHMVGALSAAIGADCHLRTVGRNSRYALLSPFPAQVELAVLTLEIAEVGAEQPWLLRFAIRTDALPALVSDRAEGAAPGEPRAPGHPLSRPFAQIPLTADAQLVDMQIPLSRLSGLAVGTVLPISVARNVPLRIGEATIAQGAVGEIDDKIAIQITQTFVSGKDEQ